MNNFGRQTVTPGTTNKFTVGQNWEYIQILNESPYLLTSTFEGMGTMDIAAWHKEDVQVISHDKRGNPQVLFDGQLFIVPVNITIGQASPQSTVVSVNAFSPGELAVPKSVALARMHNPSVDIFAEQFAFVEFTNTAVHTITIANQAGKTAVLDAIDLTCVSGATLDVNLAVTVNALITGLDYNYFISHNSATNCLTDHIIFGLNRGIQQAPGTDITIVTSQNNASLHTTVNAHYHYERNF